MMFVKMLVLIQSCMTSLSKRLVGYECHEVVLGIDPSTNSQSTTLQFILFTFT
jgi:hypothetical protein